MSLLSLDQILANNLPQNGASLIFGYGSKVIKQSGRQKEGDLIDIIIAADNPLKWHEENFIRNSKHYSFLQYLPNRIDKITRIQEQFGSRVYFNPYVKIGNLSFKYGIIKTNHLIEDLLTWNYLYIAGRLHKPVEFFVNTCGTNEHLRSALRFNKESAIRAALLQLPETFDLEQLYMTITGLSYKGDLRMILGEDVNKIENIVVDQIESFNQLYLPTIRLNQNFKELLHWSEGKRTFTQDLSTNIILRNLKLLPVNVRKTICEYHGRKLKTLESDTVLASVSRSINCDKVVARAIAQIVRKSSLSQSLKGVFTAGLIKSVKYSQRKLAKSLASRFSFF